MKLAVAARICLGVALVVGAPSTFGVEKPETSHLAFVTEYIRELSAIENIRESGEQELKEDPNSTFSNMIHSSTLFQLELGSQIKMLKGMRLKAPHDQLIPNITAFYERKILLWKRMAEIGSAFIGGPKPGVDYSKLAAEMPEIRGQLDFIDHALFEASPWVFATLIDLKADSKGHASHLVITKEERAKLLDNLNTDFGTKMDAKVQNWTVSAASVLKGYLLKDFKSSDEPWE
ncbi:MAG: hypothetical protein LAN84_12085 [Acidobacteriia bacterium]|nr:hypothetical protein [Terriglobia bacterium]